jgi:outer membrane receptor protein involved in Fe transport
VIPREELRAMGYQTIAEAVRGVRGIYLTDDRSYTTVGVRGFSRQGDYGNKVLILYDGHPFNENILGQSFPGLEGLSSLDDVQRIEVVRGPGSVLYGTGAFFGVINLVTHGTDGRTRAEAGVATHDYGVLRGRGMGYVKYDGGAIWNSVQTYQGPGRDFYFPEYRGDPSGLDGSARGIDGVHGGTVHGRATYKDLTLQWLWHQREKELPTGEYEVLFGDPRNIFIDKRGFLELRFEPKLGKAVSLMTRAHANLYTFESTAPYDPADGGLFKEEYQGRWAGFEQRIAYAPTEELRLTVGAEVQRHFEASLFGTDEFGNDYLPRDQNPYWVVGVYGVSDADLTRWLRVSAGVRFDAFQWEFAEQTVNSSSVNPRVALILKPYESGITKLMGGKAFRAPSIYERFYQSSVQTTSLDLDPEQVYSAEIEHTHRFSKAVVGTAAVFTNYVTGLVVGRGDGTDTDPFFFVNSPTPVLTVGGEVEARREWRDGWMLGASYSVQRSQYVDPAPEDGLEDGAELPNSPTHLGAVKGAVPIVGRSLTAMSRVTMSSKRYDRNETLFDPPQGTTGGALIWDLVFSGVVMDDHVRYNFGFYNINDWRYRAPVSGEFRMLGVTQAGRTFLASATLVL